MLIENKKYVIATKFFPLWFDDGTGKAVSDFKDAYLSSYDELKTKLEYFDEPENFQILEVRVTYEF